MYTFEQYLPVHGAERSESSVRFVIQTQFQHKNGCVPKEAEQHDCEGYEQQLRRFYSFICFVLA